MDFRPVGGNISTGSTIPLQLAAPLGEGFAVIFTDLRSGFENRFFGFILCFFPEEDAFLGWGVPALGGGKNPAYSCSALPAKELRWNGESGSLSICVNDRLIWSITSPSLTACNTLSAITSLLLKI